MRYLLNLAYLSLLLVAAPWLIWAAIRHGKYRQGLPQKLLGWVPSLDQTASPRIWLHAVSVGEVNLLRPILHRLICANPDAEIVISTTTQTGFELASRQFDQHAVFYCPLDFSWAVRTAISRLKPDLLVLVELELWPNLLMQAERCGIPVAIVNGRLSDRSTRGYLKLGALTRRWFSSIRLVAAQSQTCASRFQLIGVPEEKVRFVGSIKFDGAQTDRANSRTSELRKLAAIEGDDVVFLAGSTQQPEEALALAAWQNLVSDFPKLRLILVPRHPERYSEVARMLDASGIPWQARTSMSKGSCSASPVILVDTVGELGAWWGTADIGFVGGSLGSRGGQNMIEPTAYGVATCFGPNTRNFRDVVQLLLNSNAAVVIQDGTELEQFVRTCASNLEFRTELGMRARRLVAQQRGAADRTVELLTELIQTTPKVAAAIDGQPARKPA